MNLKDLEYFEQVVKDQNFTEAARAFHVSQPTVTYAIKRLEEELGTKLIIRNQAHHSLIITEAGKILSFHVKKIVRELSVAKIEISRLKDEKVKCGVPPIIGNCYFPKMSISLLENGLMQNMEVLSEGSKDLYRLLKIGAIEMAILGSLKSIRDEELESELLVEKNFRIVVSPEHPLSKRESVAFSELKDEPFVLFNEHFVHPAGLSELANQAGFRPNVIYKSSDLNILKGMIKENVGIGFLTEIAIQPSDSLVSIPIEDEDQPKFLISIVTRKHGGKSILREQIIQFISTCSY
ncbi:LysR family transcriptional regulator [Vagococcus entomophilus]|uniref:LysR family transcriptional regulator n=1 Tax=Vagococcus entomophilus TaxID=1160095 RepID=A0A430AFC6_9ENTE|nr:LysR family transcriptional regulator [Vagococcus entomophilus]RSU06424.1 LysR family transcriptional regulator [Vagococcus entomophilus]